MTTYDLGGLPAHVGVPMNRFRDALVWLMFAVSFIVFIEPAPVDAMFAVVVLACWNNGLSRMIGAIPLAVLLLMYNLGGYLSYLPSAAADPDGQFVITSTYMAITSIFLAYYVSFDPVHRFNVIKSGFIFGASFAAFFALLDYFGIFANYIHHGPIEGRATGTFKDPNVFSTYIIFPAILLIQGIMLGTAKHRVLSIAALVPILASLFFAFSRGAWINFLAAAVFMVFFSFVFNNSVKTRFRIIFVVSLALLAGAAAMIALLSVPAIRDTFMARFALIQSYDAGETGRFGNQLNAIPMLLQRPLGFGPHQFHVIFDLDPHNTFLNAFASYGWLGGISYFILVISTVIIGFKTICTRTPWQNCAIAVYCPLLTTLLQGVQIDTDHWRHLYCLMGLMWGLFAATLQPLATRDALQRAAARLGQRVAT